MNTYCNTCLTIATSHLLTSLSNFSAVEHFQERTDACQDWKNVAEGDDETAGEG